MQTNSSPSRSWSVLVSNVGTVLSTENEEDARSTFEEYAMRSVLSTGSRAYRETVSLVSPEGEPVETFSDPWTDEEGEPVPEEDLGASVLDLLESGEIEGDVYSVGSSFDPWTWTDYASGVPISWRELQPVSGSDYRERMLSGEFLVLVPLACSGSDYSGGSLARANVSALQEIADADSVVSFSVSGSHGSHGIALPLWERGTEFGLVSALRGLSAYPVVSEDALSEIEREEEEETWESSIRSDLLREIENVHGVDVDEIAEDALVSLFYDLQEATGETWEHTEEGAWIDVSRLVDGTTRAELLEIPGAVSASADEERDAGLLRGLNERPARVEFERVVDHLDRLDGEVPHRVVALLLPADRRAEGDARRADLALALDALHPRPHFVVLEVRHARVVHREDVDAVRAEAFERCVEGGLEERDVEAVGSLALPGVLRVAGLPVVAELRADLVDATVMPI